MTTQHIIEPGQAVHQAAAILSSLEYINQAEARSLGPLAEAVANGQSWPQDIPPADVCWASQSSKMVWRKAGGPLSKGGNERSRGKCQQ